MATQTREEAHQESLAALQKVRQEAEERLARESQEGGGSEEQGLDGVPAIGGLRRMQAAQTDRLKTELADVKAQLAELSDKPQEQLLDPRRVRLSRFCDRDSAAFQESDAAFRRFCASIEAAGGNVIPVLARPVKDDPNHDHEVLYGQRRWAGCRAKGKMLKASVQELSDEEAVVAMALENREREALSQYEQAERIRRFVDMGIYASDQDAAVAEQISKATMSRLRALMEMPEAVFRVLKDRRKLKARMAGDIRSALAGAPARLQRLEGVPEQSMSVAELLETLLTEDGSGPAEGEDKVFTVDGRKVLTRRVRKDHSMQLVLAAPLNDEALQRVAALIKSELDQQG